MPIASGLHYFLHEEGKPAKPPLLLIHGAGADHLSWPPEIRRLTSERVFALDLPGHGKSPGPGLQSMHGYAECAVEFLNKVDLSRAVFVGHGMGGAIALTMAIEHPDRVAGIGLFSTGACLPVAASVLENSANSTTFFLAIKTLLELMNIPKALLHLTNETSRRLSSLRPSLLHGDLQACDQFNVTDRLGEIRTATLVLCGTNDQVAPLRYSKSLAAHIPDAALQTVDGAGHLVMLEQPHRVARILSVFLKTIHYLPGM